jgi:hypothetical protein
MNLRRRSLPICGPLLVLMKHRTGFRPGCNGPAKSTEREVTVLGTHTLHHTIELRHTPGEGLRCSCLRRSCCTAMHARSSGAHRACSSARACPCRGPTTSGSAALPAAGRPGCPAAAARACACSQARAIASTPAQCTASPVEMVTHYMVTHYMQNLEAPQLVHLPGLLGSKDLARALHVTPGSSLNAVGGTIERLQYRHMHVLVEHRATIKCH